MVVMTCAKKGCPRRARAVELRRSPWRTGPRRPRPRRSRTWMRLRGNVRAIDDAVVVAVEEGVHVVEVAVAAIDEVRRRSPGARGHCAERRRDARCRAGGRSIGPGSAACRARALRGRAPCGCRWRRSCSKLQALAGEAVEVRREAASCCRRRRGIRPTGFRRVISTTLRGLRLNGSQLPRARVRSSSCIDLR